MEQAQPIEEPEPVVEEPTPVSQMQPIVVSSQVVQANPQPASAHSETLYSREKSDGLLTAAFVLNVVACICWACTLIGLAWAIPMTVHSYNILKGTKPNTVAFGVCTLLFLDVIGGILMLCAEKDQ